MSKLFHLIGTSVFLLLGATTLNAQFFFGQPNNPFITINVGFLSTPQLVDVDGDGYLDLISGEENGSILFYKNNGNDNYVQQTGGNNPFNGINVGFFSTPHLADVDGDGHLDLISGEELGRILYYKNNGSNSFTQQTGVNNPFNSIDVGFVSNPVMVDLNGDGHLDLIVGNENGNIRYYENNGSNSFTQQTGGSNPFNGIDVGFISTPVIVDLNRDGALDLIVGNENGNIRYYENNGSNSFTQQTGSNNPFNSISVEDSAAPDLEDVDRDGDLDLIIGTENGRMVYYVNDGANHFQLLNPFSDIDVGDNSAPQLVDVDGDGDLDLISGAKNGTIIYYQRQTNGSYIQQTGSNHPFAGVDVGDDSAPQLVDVDGDDDLDLIIGEFNGTIIYYRQEANDYFQQTGSNNPFDGIDVGRESAPQLVDVDKDGDLDLIIGESGGTIIYYQRQADGSYVQQTESNNPFDGIEVGDGFNSTPQLVDVDGDGDLDLISGDFGRNRIYYYQQQANGSYVQQTGNNNPFDGIEVGDESTPQLVDVDGDGDLDLISGARSGLIFYYQNLPSGLPAGVNSYIDCSTGIFSDIDVGFNSTPQLVDVDEDGDLDLIIGESEGGITYYRQQANGSYIQQTGSNNPFDGIDVGDDSAPQLVDVDGDDDLDLIIGEKIGTIIYYRQQANGSYVQQTDSNNPFDGINVGEFSTPQLVDVDGDTDLDLIIGEERGTIIYYQQQDNGSYVQQIGSDNPFDGIDVGFRSTPQVVDVDGDSDLDLISGDDNGRIIYYQQQDNGSYVQQTGSNNPFNGIDVGFRSTPQLVDVDEDGDLDLISGEFFGSIRFYPTLDLSARATSCNNNEGEVTINISSPDTEGPYSISGLLSGKIGSAGTLGATQTLTTGINESGIYAFEVGTELGCKVVAAITEIDENCTVTTISITPRVNLQGAFNGTSMDAALTTNNLVPTTEPYTASGYTFVGGGGGESTAAKVLAMTGSCAIVDWVVVELRDAGSGSVVNESRAALLRADGVVVATDGISPLMFSAPLGTSYHVAVKHRNHLAIVTKCPIQF